MPNADLLLATTTLAGVLIVSLALLKAWQGWLDLKAAELDRRGTHSARSSPHHGPGDELDRMDGTGAARIEVADLKERIRKLEAIASGVDL